MVTSRKTCESKDPLAGFRVSFSYKLFWSTHYFSFHIHTTQSCGKSQLILNALLVFTNILTNQSFMQNFWKSCFYQLKYIKFISLTFTSLYKLTPILFSSFTAQHFSSYTYAWPNSLVVLVYFYLTDSVIFFFFYALWLSPLFPPNWTTVWSATFWNLSMTKSRNFHHFSTDYEFSTQWTLIMLWGCLLDSYKIRVLYYSYFSYNKNTVLLYY